MYTQVHAYMYPFVSLSTLTHKHPHIYISMFAYIPKCAHTRMHLYVNLHVYTHAKKLYTQQNTDKRGLRQKNNWSYIMAMLLLFTFESFVCFYNSKTNNHIFVQQCMCVREIIVVSTAKRW